MGLHDLVKGGGKQEDVAHLASKISKSVMAKIDKIAEEHNLKKRDVIEQLLKDGLDTFERDKKTEKAAKAA